MTIQRLNCHFSKIIIRATIHHCLKGLPSASFQATHLLSTEFVAVCASRRLWRCCVVSLVVLLVCGLTILILSSFARSSTSDLRPTPSISSVPTLAWTSKTCSCWGSCVEWTFNIVSWSRGLRVGFRFPGRHARSHTWHAFWWCTAHDETNTATEHSRCVGGQTLDARCIQFRANGQRHECNGGVGLTCMQKLSHPHWDRSCIRHHLGLSVWSRMSPNVYHVFNGPDDFNGYGYFPVRLYRTEAGFQAPMLTKKVALVSRSLDLFSVPAAGIWCRFLSDFIVDNISS